jgi:tRNA threonylcarbamoyladenosine biosynthesis protein TsaE
VQTRTLGELLGGIVPKGTVIVLQGDLAAGKTQFVQGLAKGLGIEPNEVQSPTFALLHIYSGRLTLYHFDWYRIVDDVEFEQLGFDEYLDAGDGVVAIEWGERFASWLPPDALWITFTPGSDMSERQIAFTCADEAPSSLVLAEFKALYDQWAAVDDENRGFCQ